MTYERKGHTVSVLTNGKVLITGGINDHSDVLTSAKLYGSLTGNWLFADNMHYTRHSCTASVLTNGKVIVAGGYGSNMINRLEFYDPPREKWTIDSERMNYERYCHTASVLLNGKVLVTGRCSNGLSNTTKLY